MANDLLNGGLDHILERFYLWQRLDIDLESEEHACFRDWLADRCFDFDLIVDYQGSIGQLPDLYATYLSSLPTLEELVDIAEKVDLEQDAIEKYLEAHWENKPPFPLVFFAAKYGRLNLCVDYKPIITDFLRWADFDSYQELELGYVHKKLDEYLALISADAISYEKWLNDNKNTVFSWLEFKEECDFDPESDKFCISGHKRQYTADELPVDYFIESATNRYLDAEDIEKISVVRVPHREDVLAALSEHPAIRNCFMDFPYAIVMNAITLLEPEKIYSLDDLMAFAALDLLDSTTDALIADAMTAADPADYVAAQMAFALQTHNYLPIPIISISLPNVAGKAWDKISPHLPRFKKRPSAVSREVEKLKKQVASRGVAGTIFDTVMGR